MVNDALSLYLITDSTNLNEPTFFSRVEEALKAGVTMVQVREKDATSRDFYQKALKVKELTDRYEVPLIINDRLDIALAVDADGIHIGDDELPVDLVRSFMKEGKILGVSAKTVERAKEAQDLGADYLGVGAVFPTTTKDSSVLTRDLIDQIVNSVQIPSVAIGGIKEDNINQLQGLSIAGISVISEIMYAEDVQYKVKNLLKAVENL